MERLERWAVIMDSKSLGCSRVNDARRQLFTHVTRMFDHISPNQAALFQHARRPLLQAAFIWKHVKESQQHVRESRNGFGCKRREPKTGCYFEQSCLMQAVPVRSCIIVVLQKPAEVTTNAARQDSGALFYVTV